MSITGAAISPIRLAIIWHPPVIVMSMMGWAADDPRCGHDPRVFLGVWIDRDHTVSVVLFFQHPPSIQGHVHHRRIAGLGFLVPVQDAPFYAGLPLPAFFLLCLGALFPLGFVCFVSPCVRLASSADLRVALWTLYQSRLFQGHGGPAPTEKEKSLGGHKYPYD
ncbi:hypothetical protein F4860DRAFT_514562 [Xylaria cubensis]|nr:hypothetical protein F4860DRAFT_514562 [Xylaria cubensis]